LELNGQTYDVMLFVQTLTIVFILGNKIQFCSAVLIFGSRSMVALPIDHNDNRMTTLDKGMMSHQTHGITKWCWTWRDKGINRLQ